MLVLALVSVGVAVIHAPEVDLELFVSPDAWEPEEARLLAEPIEAFNDAKVRVHGGGPVIQINPRDVESGRAEEQISEHPSSSPDVWIPASSIWSRLAGSKHPSLIDFDQPSLVKSPLVLAVWERFGLRLEHPLGWDDVARFAEDPSAWRAAVGVDAGPFQLAHLNPERSTSGLSAAVSEFYLGAGLSEGLKESDLTRAEDIVEQIEGSIVHYGSTSGDMLEQFACYGPAYASMVYIQKTTLERFNAEGYDVPPSCPDKEAPVTEDLAPYFPAEGTFVADYPCTVLHADDRDELQEAAAGQFCSWLQDWLRKHPRHVTRFNFVPAGRLGGDGLPSSTLEGPSGSVLEEIQARWKTLRRAADVMIAIDTSSGMEDELDAIRRELSGCLDGFVERDRVGLVSFGDVASHKVNLGPSESTREAILAAVRRLVPKGGTALDDAVVMGLRAIRGDYDPRRITAVVVITDGFETGDTSRGGYDLLEELRNEDMPVRVFVVEDGGDLQNDVQDLLVGETQGRSFRVDDEADPLSGDTPIAKLCDEVFSFF